MKRRALSIILSAVLIIGMLPTMAWAADYGDTQGHWAEGAIDRWSDYGVVNGKGQGSFDPNGSMRRAEAAQVFANLLGLNKEGDISEFTDVEDDWYTSALAKCYAAGIISGKGEGKMDPNGLITREEFFTMFARAVCISNGGNAADVKSGLSDKGYTDTAKVSDWAADAIGTLVEKGYVGGVSASEIAPQLNINRASVMALLDQSISTYVGKNSTETTVTAKSEGITLIANPAVTNVTGMADVVVVAAGAEQYDETTGEITHNDIRVESAKMPVARVQGENITVTLAVNTEAEDAEVTETAVKSEIVVDSTATVNKLTVSAEGAKATVSGKVETVKVEETAKNAAVETKANSTVGTLNVAAEDVKTTVAGKVDTVKVEETAKNVAVETKSTAKVETVENKAENTAVTGTGSVGAVKSSEDVKIETKNTKVENTSETKEIAVTDSKGTETKVDSGTTGQTTPSAPTGGGHSHSYATEWTYDATDHWHAATCSHKDEKSGLAAHSFDATTHRCECGAFDPNVVAAIGEQGYETLEAALAAAADGQTVTLVKNVTGTITSDKKVAFTIDEAITLDGNGKTITVSGNSGNDTYGIYVNAETAIQATIKNLTLNTTGTERAIRFGGKAGGTVKDSTITSEAVGIHVKGTGAVAIDNVDITVNAIAAFDAHRRAGVVVGAETTATMSNSKIVVNTLDKTESTLTWGKGAYVGTGAKGKLILNNTDITADFALAIDGSSDENKLNNITVNSGTIKGDLGSPGGYSYKEIVINGGTFDPYNINSMNSSFADKTTATHRLIITGGTFSAKPDAKYIPAGYVVTDNGDGTYTVEATWAAFAASGFETAVDTTNKIVTVASAEELALFAKDINSYKDYTANITADIDLGGKLWVPISDFKGVFDGNDHTISNLTIADGGTYTAFFAMLGGTVKDVTFDDAIVKTTNESGRAAVVAECTSAGVVEINNVKILNSVVDSVQKTGGLLGFASGCQNFGCVNVTIKDCTVDGLTFVGGEQERAWQAGAVIGYVDAQQDVTVTGNTVKNVTMEYDPATAYPNNPLFASHPIIGALTLSHNTYDCSTYTITVQNNRVENCTGFATNSTTTNFCGGLSNPADLKKATLVLDAVE